LTDSEKGQREHRELAGIVASTFEDPASVAPLSEGWRKRPQLRLWEEPSFDNYRCWAVWGPAETGQPTGLLRRIIWRRDVDGDRGNPMRRLQRLDLPLRPTLEVSDASIDLSGLAIWLRAMRPARPPETTMQRPRSIPLDGEWYGLEVVTGNAKWRYEWFGVNANWTPSDPAHEAFARWAVRFRDWLDSQFVAIAGTDR
jgi:hypothetical protein